MASTRKTSLLFLLLLIMPSPVIGQESLADFMDRIIEDDEVNDVDLKANAVPPRDEVNPDAVPSKDEEKQPDDDDPFWTSETIGWTAGGSVSGLALIIGVIKLILQIRNDAEVIWHAMRRIADAAAFFMALLGRVRRRPAVIALPSP